MNANSFGAQAACQSTITTTKSKGYELLARLLVGAVEQDASGAVRAAVNGAALEAGRRAGAESDRNVVDALRNCGYLPHVDDDGRVSLRNCPFHMVARDHRDVVCGLNQRLVEGIIATCDQPQAHAELNPHPDRCCVVMRGAVSPRTHASPTRAPSSEREVR